MTSAGIFVPALPASQRRLLLLLVLFWIVGTLSFWRWALQPSVWVSVPGTFLNLAILVYGSALPAWPFYLFLRMRQVRQDLPVLEGLKVAMVVTKTPSEPWPLVKQTLVAMLNQDPRHDTWLADEKPSDEVLQWCSMNRIKVSTRAGLADYHRPTWPRRTRCKEGNLAYFYDHYGYSDYDVVVQIDADHVPQEGYLKAMLQPFSDPSIGYVAAPSICSTNAYRSWAARGRLYAESLMHGPLQLGLNGRWAPLCFGSHYAVRTSALKQIGGLGPELAEDHSTTLLFNAAGWKGAFAHRAICLGLGPETFEDCMVQEFQWSRSLTIVLLKHLPSAMRQLPTHLSFQFFYWQLYYPLLAALFLSSLSLPVIALIFDYPWMRVNYPTFIIFCILQTFLTLLPAIYLRRMGLLRPTNARPLSWEHWLFGLSRAPWVLAGVASGVRHALWPRPVNYRVTRKQLVSAPIPLTYLAPYLLVVSLGVGSTIFFGASSRFAQGYILLVLITASMFAIGALAVSVLSHRQGDRSLSRHLPHLSLAGCAVLITLLCFVWQLPELADPIQLPTGSSIAVF
jgi:cellulose synthase (UDP-forming)